MTVGLVVATFTFVENLKKAKKTIDDVRKEVREVTNDENEDRPEGG